MKISKVIVIVINELLPISVLIFIFIKYFRKKKDNENNIIKQLKQIVKKMRIKKGNIPRLKQ